LALLRGIPYLEDENFVKILGNLYRSVGVEQSDCPLLTYKAMTQSNDKPAGNSPEATPPDSKSLAASLDAFALLSNHSGVHPAAGDKTVHTPAKAVDDRSGASALAQGFTGAAAGFGDSTALAAGGKVKTDAELAEARAHNAGQDQGANPIFSFAKSMLAAVPHTPEIVRGLYDTGKKAVHTVETGSTNEKLELLGAGIFTVGTFVAPGAGGLGKLTTERNAVGLAEKGMAEASGARTTMTAYKETAIVSHDAAFANAEARVAATADRTLLAAKPVVTAGREAAVVAKPVVDAEAASRAINTADVGARLHLPALEPVTPSAGLASRIKSTITAPFKSILGSTETAAGEATGNKFGNLFRDEKPVGTLPSHLKVDGLKTGDVTLPGVRNTEHAVVELPAEPVKVPGVKAEPVKLPVANGDLPDKVSPKVETVVPTKPHLEPTEGLPVKPVEGHGQPLVAKATVEPPLETHGQPVKITSGEGVHGTPADVAPKGKSTAGGQTGRTAETTLPQLEQKGLVETTGKTTGVGDVPVTRTGGPVETPVVTAPKAVDVAVEPVKGAPVHTTPSGETPNVAPRGSRVANADANVAPALDHPTNVTEPKNLTGNATTDHPVAPVKQPATVLNADSHLPAQTVTGNEAAVLEPHATVKPGTGNVEVPVNAAGTDLNRAAGTDLNRAAGTDLNHAAGTELNHATGTDLTHGVANPVDATAGNAGASGLQLEKPVVAGVTPAVAEAPAVIAGKASNSLENFTRATSEKGITLTPDAQRGLQEISTQLKAVSQGTEQTLSLAARNQISKNLATVEQSLGATAADTNIARQLSDLKTSVNELAPAAVGPVAPLTEAPAVIATRAGENLQAFNTLAEQKGLTLTPEVKQSLARIDTQVQSVARGTATASAQTSAQIGQDLATVERSLTASGADPAVLKQFDSVKASLGDMSTATVEREQLASLNRSMTTLDTQGAQLSTNVKALSTKLQDLPSMSLADQKVATTISTKLDAVEQKIATGGLRETPLATTADIQQVVRDLDKPEYSTFFANNPDAARAFNEVKTATADVAATTGRVESTQAGLGTIKEARVFQQNVDNLALLSRDLKSTLPAAEATQPVAKALTEIESDLGTIKAGAKPEVVFRNVQAKIDAIEGAGATDLAKNLRQNLGDLETTSTTIERTRQLEAHVSTVRTEAASLDAQSTKLSAQLSEDAVTAPSTTAMLPNNAQVADQLQLISRQTKLLDGTEASTAAVNKIKDAWTKVEDLTAGANLTADQQAAMAQMRQSIANIDRASVEATGLRTLESKSAQIGTQSTRVEALTSDIAKGVNTASPTAAEIQVQQKLSNINKAAQEVRAARTLDDQINAANRLGTAVEDPELQAYLASNKTGLKTLEDLKVTTAQVHDAVSYRALEQSKNIAAAEAENAVNASRAIEARVQKDIALADSPAVQTAATDYRIATEQYLASQNKAMAAAQMEQKLEALQAQLKLASRNSAIATSEEMVAAQRAQQSLGQALSDSQVMSRSLIDRRLPNIEQGFDQIGRVDSSVVQRDLMRNISNQIQSLRYLEGQTGLGADQLAQAQMQLTRAQNDLEVATYRRNMIKMAAAGDQAAADRLLVAGLTSDGYKTASMAASSGPAARLMEDFAKNHSNLQGLVEQPSYRVRSLASSDPLFVNNQGWLSANVIRNTGLAMAGTGLAMAGTGLVRDMMRSGGSDASPDRSVQSGATTVSNKPTGASGQSPDGRVIGRSGGDAGGFTPNGQTVARQAYSQEMATQAVPHGAGANSDVLQPSLGLLPPDNIASFRPAVASAGPFVVYNNDINRDPELYRLQYSGTLYGVKYAGDPQPEAATVVPLNLAHSIHVGRGGHGGAKPLEKPATSQFVMPTTSLSSPFALAGGVVGKRDVLTTRLGGGAFGGAGSTTTGIDTGLKFTSLSDSEGEDSEGGAGATHLKRVERTESRGLDTHAGHASGSHSGTNTAGANDEEGNGEPDPTVTTAANSPTAAHDPTANATANAAVDPATGLPLAAAPGATPANNTDPVTGAPVTAATKQNDPSAIGTPPRRRATKDAISA
jgi:hypothetical protein